MREGVQEWRNPKNRLFVCQVHWTSDARKRTSEGKAQMEQLRAEIGRRAFAREYDLDWTSPEGEPVIPEFSPRVHVLPTPVDPGGKLLRFWDFGFVSPVVLFAQLSPMDQLRIVRELCPFNVPLDQLLPMVFAITRDLVIDPKKVFDAGDPAATSQTDLGSAAEVIARHGIHLHVSRPGSEVSYAHLRQRCLKRIWVPSEGEIPGLQIDPTCRNLIEALSGAFHLSPHPPYKPQKVHPYKDVVDALRYGNDNLGPALSFDFAAKARQIASGDVQQTYATY